jgi:hypothetical protein
MRLGIILWTLMIVVFAPVAAASAPYFQQEIMRSRGRGSDNSTQWTIVDWLQQKNVNALADQWLALHSSNSLFDISANASGQRYKLKSTVGNVTSSQDANSQSYGLDMYISIFGIHGEYEKTEDKLETYGGSAGLRLLGTSSSSTNLSVHYGIQVRHDLVALEQWQNQYLNGQLTLYVIKNFGLNGQYRYYFPADSNKGARLEGNKVTAGAFVEFLPFRVQASYFHEPLKITRGVAEELQDRAGYDVSVRLIF